MAINSVVALLAMLAVVTSGTASVALANGAARIIVQDQPVGPYVRVGIVPGTPTVGLLHLSILVRDAAAEAPVTDAAVSVVAVGPEGSGGPFRMDALNSLGNPQLYEGNLSLDVMGPWVLTLETDSPLGNATLEVPIEVRESSPINLTFIMLGAAVVLVAAALFWSQRLRSRHRRSSGRAR